MGKQIAVISRTGGTAIVLHVLIVAVKCVAVRYIGKQPVRNGLQAGFVLAGLGQALVLLLLELGEDEEDGHDDRDDQDTAERFWFHAGISPSLIKLKSAPDRSCRGAP